ncbi:NusA-like transcription termination signal-binding factor [Candidatus Woesearchaeota archaeon]|nr:NusA-like transcription termination signal-binding factor [Candidatus Woesearchaeota archaeon]
MGNGKSAGKIVFDVHLLQVMALFEKVTHAKLKDCIETEDAFVFVVLPNELGRAIGPKARNVQTLVRLLKKRVRLVEFSDDCISFIKNLLYPVLVKNIVIEDDIVTIAAPDSLSRGVLIGRNACHLRANEAIVQRYFPVTEMRVS